MTAEERREYQQALKTYNGRCAMCGNSVVELHHIVYRRYGKTVKENLIPLCKTDHMLVHTDQAYYTEYLLDLNRKHYGMIEINDLKKHGKYAEFKYGN